MLVDTESKAVFEIRPAAIIAWIFLLNYLGAPDWMYYTAITATFILDIRNAPYFLKGYLAIPAFILWAGNKLTWVMSGMLIDAPWWFFLLVVFAEKKGIINTIAWIVLLYLINAPWWMYLLGILA